ncbi:MAG: translation elongation factor Ts [Deltaproteobacteria bacterium]|nr:translation elongation factor Ts [Deltaproteobacteria bacterium]
MAEISASMVKDLREKTSAGMMDCKAALTEAQGNYDKAVEILRMKGLKNVSKRAGKVAAEGQIYSYIHAGSRVGVMLELNTETDFVAKSDEFTDLCKRIAMHVAWSNPRFLGREEIPAAVIEQESAIYRSQLTPQQEKVADKIIAGKLDKFYSEVCLVEQEDSRDPSTKKKISDLIGELSAKVGEKIVLRRFIRFEVGEGIEKKDSDFAAEVKAAANI